MVFSGFSRPESPRRREKKGDNREKQGANREKKRGKQSGECRAPKQRVANPSTLPPSVGVGALAAG
jgi:hypothetical protein